MSRTRYTQIRKFRNDLPITKSRSCLQYSILIDKGIFIIPRSLPRLHMKEVWIRSFEWWAGTVVCILVRMKSFPRFWRNQKYFFWKKNQNSRLKKNSFSSSANSQYFFMKISWIGPWVSRIDWCEGYWFVSTFVAVRLSDISSKTP